VPLDIHWLTSLQSLWNTSAVSVLEKKAALALKVANLVILDL